MRVIRVNQTQDSRRKAQESELQMKENFLHLKSCVLSLPLYISALEGRNVNPEFANSTKQEVPLASFSEIKQTAG
jgi:hypothetical protein